MNKAKETVADIVAEMMDEGHIGGSSFLEWVGANILHDADRIEAANFRECEALREERNRAGLTEREKLATRIRELKVVSVY